MFIADKNWAQKFCDFYQINFKIDSYILRCYYLENVTFPFYQALLWGWDVYLSRGTETEL